MKRFALILLVLLTGISSHAQQWISLGRTADRAEVTIDQVEKLQIEFGYAAIRSSQIENRNGAFAELLLEGGNTDGEVGQPKLPVTQRFIEIPFGAEPQVKVIGSTMLEFDLGDYGIQKIVPVQPPVSKEDVPESMPFVMDEETYANDAYLGYDLASIQVVGTMRGYRIAKLTVAPVKYNPVRNKIQVYNDITLEVTFPGADLALTKEIKSKTYSPYFDFVGSYMMNKGVSDYPDHPDLTRYPIKYVIVADRMFEGYLSEFIEWKTKKGFDVVLAYTDEIGATTSAIQSYLHGLYNAATPEDPAPSFILFVGDTPQIPAYTGQATNKVTDLYYTSVDGDYFPEMYYGRFSAQRVEQLLPQIEKTLYYEQYQFSDPSYLNRATLIAGWDSYWNQQIAQPTIRYGLEYWFNENNNYTEVYPYYGPDDYDGCYDDDKVSVSMINYTAHCSETVWGTPALSSSTISRMNNEDFYPLAIGNCCLSGSFGYGECVGESWVRADKKGAVCYIGSAPNTYWYEDAWWAMGAYHITDNILGQTPEYTQTTMGSYDAMHLGGYVTTGGLTFCGNLAVTEACNHQWSTAALYYWEAYNVLGDPSLICYHTEGSVNQVSYDPVLIKGADTFSVEAEPQSLVALSKDGVLIGSGLVGESGELTLSIDAVTESGFVDIVVTRPQSIPFLSHVPVAVSGQPYLVVTSVEPAVFDYDQETSLSVVVKNVGDQPVPANTRIQLDGYGNDFELNTMTAYTSAEIPVGGSQEITDAYVVKAGPEVDNGGQYRFLTHADCGDEVYSDFYVTVNKPVFEFVGFTWSEGFASGGSFDIYANFKNVGGCASKASVGHISTSHPGLWFVQTSSEAGGVAVGETVTCTYTIYVAESVGDTEALDFIVSIDDHGVHAEKDIMIRNQCPVVFTLHDAGGNGWEGAYIRLGFDNGGGQLNLDLPEGSTAEYRLVVDKGVKLIAFWMRGNNDEECSFTVSYEDGEVIYESGSLQNGYLFVAEMDCAMHPTAVMENTAVFSRVSVFPNPTSGQVNIVSPIPMQRCLLLNSLGQVVIDKTMNDVESSLNLHGYAPGIYLLKVNTAEGEVVQKIMVK